MTQALYPLRFRPIYKEKVWGGRRLESLGRALPSPTARIGESWELADLATTSVSGGGGGSERSVIDNGPLAGLTLRDAVARFGPDLLGRLELNAFHEFPLLVKFLDAAENLSVQVHPSRRYLAEHPGEQAFLKSEAWYILHAQPGAVIYKGVHDGVTPADFRSAILHNDRDALLRMMITVPVKPGDCHYLPSGTCHALGAGLLVAEVQTPSDTTFRVYDWGRTDRQLHVEQAMRSIHFGPPDTARAERRTHIAGMHTTVSRLCTCEHFRIEKIRMTEGYQQDIPYDQPAVWIVLEGGGTFDPRNGVPTVAFAGGQTLLIPAHMNHATVKLDRDTTWLEVTFPQALSEPLA